MRKQYEGELVVYRDNMFVEHLSAQVMTNCGERFEYYRSPKSFEDLIVNGIKNKIRVRFTANEDGSNPRSVVAISEAW